jgi:hypothetical protein
LLIAWHAIELPGGHDVDLLSSRYLRADTMQYIQLAVSTVPPGMAAALNGITRLPASMQAARVRGSQPSRVCAYTLRIMVACVLLVRICTSLFWAAFRVPASIISAIAHAGLSSPLLRRAV